MSVNELREDVRRLQFYEDRADWNAILNKPSLFPPLAHGHNQADIIDLVSDLAAIVASIAAKQNTLVSGTNIRTVNGTSLLGAGNLATGVTGSASLTWTAIAAGASATQDITVTGAALGDRVVMGLPNDLADGLIANAWVQAADTVRVRITNVTTGSLTPNSGVATTYSATALRF